MTSETCTTTPKLPVSRDAPGYQFPGSSIPPRVSAQETAHLIRLLDGLSHRRRAGTTLLRPYSEIRTVFCQINLELNERGGPAPRFRPLRKPLPRAATGYAEADHLLSNDRQVIDLHWLNRRRVKLNYKNRKWEGLTAGGAFDFALAASFVTTVGSVETKAKEVIRIPERLQWQLASLQCKKIAARWREVERRAAEDVWPALEEAAEERPELRPVIGDWFLIWKCAELMGPKPRAGPLVNLARLAGLRVIDPSNTMKKLRKTQSLLE